MNDAPVSTPIHEEQSGAHTPDNDSDTTSDLGDDGLDDLDDIEFVLEEIENRIAPLA